MNKEPIGLYIFRFIMGFGLFAFMGMLYWSSVLLEEDTKDLKKEVAELKGDIFKLNIETQEMQEEVLKAILEDQRHRQQMLSGILHNTLEIQHLRTNDLAKNLPLKELHANQSKQDNANRPHMDSKIPNLLSKDTFYSKTLPDLLGKDFKPDGVRLEATVGKPDHLHPFSNWSSVSSWRNMCNVNLGTLEFGKFETLAQDMAIKIEARPQQDVDIIEFWVHLRDNVFWQPLQQDHFSEDLVLAPHFIRKHKVTAHDYKFYFDAVMNPFVQEPGAAASRNYIGDIEKIEVLDDLTFIVRWKPLEVEEKGKKVAKIKYIAKQLTGSLQPLARFVYQYFPDGKKIVEEDKDPETYRKNSVWAQNFGQHWARNVIVSCGPWIFDGMTERQIRFKRNPDHYKPYAALTKAIEIEFKESPDGVWQDFKAGKLDTYQLRPTQLIELDEFLQSDAYRKQSEKGLKINKIEYVGRAYNYIGWNQNTPFFKSKKVRQAMTLAIDRERVIEQNLNNLGIKITGPFFLYSPSYNNKIQDWPFDVEKAKRYLEEDGWFDSDGDGIVDKMINGKQVPFRFSLTYYVKNPTSKANCEYIATALKEIKVDCQLNGVDIADLSSAFDEKDFEGIYLGWALGSPPEEPKQLWHSAGAKEKGSSNAVGFANTEADQIIEQLQYEYSPEKRRELYHRFHAIIHEEAPYTFLFNPKSVMVYREYVKNVFIPAERQDLVPGANVATPDSSVFWLKKKQSETLTDLSR